MPPPNDSAIRIVTYNILKGGTGRADPILETLRYLNADVIGLCEASDPHLVRYLGERLGLEYLVAESIHGPMHVALLSRRPIERMINLTQRCDLDRAAMEVVIDFAGEPLRFVVAHLKSGLLPDGEQTRRAELQQILAVLDEQPMPTLLMGDLNASARTTPLDIDRTSPKAKKRLAKRGNTLDYTVTDHLLAAGWIDAYRQVHPDEPGYTFSTAYPALRIDYIFATADLAGRIRAAGVETAGFAPHCSDHFPLWAELAL